MGGFFGAVSDRDVALDVFFGTDYHSHLGTRRGGMVLFDKKEGFQRQIHNIENTPFRTKFERDLADFRGHAAVSYPHLDVYKRQAYGSTRFAAPTPMAVAPASISSMTSSAVVTPPMPTMGMETAS